jgi:ketosteroid isomerase-like protein
MTTVMMPQEARGSDDPVAIGANLDALRAIYADLTKIGDCSAEGVVLHTAERELPNAVRAYRGRSAVVGREADLVAALRGELVMDVEFLSATAYFAAVAGKLRATLDGEQLAMPFCGLWRFEDGKIVEHWENAYDAAAFEEFIARHASSGMRQPPGIT